MVPLLKGMPVQGFLKARAVHRVAGANVTAYLGYELTWHSLEEQRQSKGKT